MTYNVYRSGNVGLEFLANTTNTNCHDRSMASGIEYEYSVVTVDAFGAEDPAATVVVRTP